MVDHLQSRVTPWRQYASHVEVRGTSSKMDVFKGNCFNSHSLKIKGSIKLAHGSICSDVRKLQSMDVLKLQSAKADWNTKCSFHMSAYIYSNLLDISTSYFIKILSYNENLDVDSQRTKKMHLSFGFRG